MKNKVINGQWYEVLRADGTKQYARGSVHKGVEGYLLYGSGFTISEFDAVSVTPIDKVPCNKKKGYAYFDDLELKDYFKCICNTNNRWNGWMMPSIHEDDAYRLCKMLSWDEEKYFIKDKKIVCRNIHDGDYTSDSFIHTDGQRYYSFDFGLCFDFITEEDYKKELCNLLEDTP